MPSHYVVAILPASSQRVFNACRAAESSRNESRQARARTMPPRAKSAPSVLGPFAAIFRPPEPRTPWTRVHVLDWLRSTRAERRLRFAWVLRGVERWGFA